MFKCAGNGELQQHKWLVAACAAAGSSADMALNKGALHLSLDPTAVIAVLLQLAGNEVSVVPASGAPLHVAWCSTTPYGDCGRAWFCHCQTTLDACIIYQMPLPPPRMALRLPCDILCCRSIGTI